MVEQRDKVLSYRQVHWFRKPRQGTSLEDLIVKSYAELKTAKARTVKRKAQTVRLSKKRQRTGGGIWLHYTVDTPGEYASIVMSGKDDDEDVETGTVQPPSNAEYLDGDAFVLVVKNDVFTCTTAIREKAIRFIIAATLEKAGLDKDSDQFDVRAAANINKVALMHAEGVREIDLKASLYAASHRHSERKHVPSNLMKAVANGIKAFIDPEIPDEDDNLKVSLIMKTDGRMRTGVVSGRRKIENIAQGIIETAEDDDEFKIITRKGQTISQSEIYMNTKVSLEKNGKSVSREHAWSELESYYSDLDENGSLER